MPSTAACPQQKLQESACSSAQQPPAEHSQCGSPTPFLPPYLLPSPLISHPGLTCTLLKSMPGRWYPLRADAAYASRSVRHCCAGVRLRSPNDS